MPPLYELFCESCGEEADDNHYLTLDAAIEAAKKHGGQEGGSHMQVGRVGGPLVWDSLQPVKPFTSS